MSVRMCTQSFVALRCLLRKPWGFIENWYQQKQGGRGVKGRKRREKGRKWKGRAREGEEGKEGEGRAPNNFSPPSFGFLEICLPPRVVVWRPSPKIPSNICVDLIILDSMCYICRWYYVSIFIQTVVMVDPEKPVYSETQSVMAVQGHCKYR